MPSKMLAGLIVLVPLAAAGCIGVGPHYTYLFQHGSEFSEDVLPYSPDKNYLAVHAKGRPGWYVLRFETPEGEFDNDFTTGSGELQAWYFPPLAADKVKRPEEIYAPDLDYFVEHSDSPLFAKRAVKLDGTIRVRGEGSMIKSVRLDLTANDDHDLNLKGDVRRNLQFVRLDVPQFEN
ncbi:MAG: hypothetical protein ACT4QC_12865 [Planctomycetaceae bacterium]